MKKTRAAFLALIVFVAILATAAIVGGLSAEPTQGASLPITVNSALITQTTTFDRSQWSNVGGVETSAEIFYDIDQGSTPNTLTLKLQASPDIVQWTDYSTFVTDNLADVTAYTTTNILGRYFRIVATVPVTGNAEPVTATIKVVLR